MKGKSKLMRQKIIVFFLARRIVEEPGPSRWIGTEMAISLMGLRGDEVKKQLFKNVLETMFQDGLLNKFGRKHGWYWQLKSEEVISEFGSYFVS